MTEQTKPAPEKTESASKDESLTQPAEGKPVAPAAPTAMLVPEEGSGPTVKG